MIWGVLYAIVAAIVSLLAPGLFRKLAPKVVPIIVAAAGKR